MVCRDSQNTLNKNVIHIMPEFKLCFSMFILHIQTIRAYILCTFLLKQSFEMLGLNKYVNKLELVDLLIYLFDHINCIFMATCTVSTEQIIYL